jgi:aldehyde dehydrogenase (NAD+)
VNTYQLFVDGVFQDALDGATSPVFSPFNGAEIARCAWAGAADVDRAVRAARTAFDEGPWPRMSPQERGSLLLALAAAITAQKSRLTDLEVLDSGSTIRKAKEDIYLSSRNLSGFAKLGMAAAGEELDGVSRPGFSRNLLWREPVGVVAAIIPWNFPLKMAVWKLGPALISGNTVVLKPSEETPVTAMELAALLRDTGFPPGVVNIIPGTGPAAGAPLAAHPLVDMVAFTGSTDVGRNIMTAAAGTLKKITLECGGKSANIVLDDADLPHAVDGALYAAFYHQGQCCEAGTRLFLPDTLADRFLEAMVEKARRMKSGDPRDPATDIGPLISARQRDRVLGYIAGARRDGARILCGGGPPAAPECASGFFVEPTIIDGVDNGSTLAREEVFGPVLAVIRYRTVDEAVHMANDSIYGLAGGVWSSAPERALDVARRLRAGTVWINEWHLLHERAPFGGYRQSGIGREFGTDGLHEFTEAKHVHIDEVGAREKKTWYDTVVPRG